MRFKRNLLISYCLLLGIATQAQKDSLVLKNGNVIVGEIKSLDKGVLTIETPYSKNDFTIEWGGIREIFSKSQFLVTLTSGTRINGTFESVEGGKKIVITDVGGLKTETTFEEMVYLKGLKSDFWSRAYASLDVGLSFTKANNLKQYNVRSKFGYLADKWQFDFFYDDTRSKQDSVAETKRTEGGLAAKYFLQKRGLPVRTISRATAFQLTPEQRKTLDESHDSFLGWCERLDIKPVTVEKLECHNKEYYLVK